jgi:prepilin-type N-terminal cleavage/methylation domain-containing protein
MKLRTNSRDLSRAGDTRAGFTLIELMVVVAIVGTLSSVAVPKFLDYMKKGKRAEAEVHLAAISKAAESQFIENAYFPQTGSALTPAQRCCEQPGKKCAINAADWNGVQAWDELGFEMTQPFYFQYRYRSDAPSVYVATAVGDLDCDGIPITFTMAGDATSGSPSSTLTRPARAD